MLIWSKIRPLTLVVTPLETPNPSPCVCRESLFQFRIEACKIYELYQYNLPAHEQSNLPKKKKSQSREEAQDQPKRSPPIPALC